MDIDPSFEQPALQLAQQLLLSHGETVSFSHMHWLVRETAKLMARDMELTKRERELQRRENTWKRKGRRGGNGGGTPSPQEGLTSRSREA